MYPILQYYNKLSNYLRAYSIAAEVAQRLTIRQKSAVVAHLLTIRAKNESDMAMSKTGNLSIHTENIFPIIKKFLYSNQEVFLRELVSNAVDATQKLRTLSSLGEAGGELGDLTIEIKIDEPARTLTISDAGIGMTEEEIEKYINQIAFSGADEFLKKYKDTANQIIGHFGLGFYSAFMVADKVEIVTRSYKPDAPAVRWSCDGSTNFTIEPATREKRGTDVILHISTDSEDYLKSWRINEVLKKYSRFVPVPVKFEDKIINQATPLWTKKPTELTEQQYLDFYNELFPYTEPPMFWIHLNVDYPFNLTGILYFPKIRPNLELHKDKIHLYSNQVFITDHLEEIVPEYLALLHGIIDSPDIPLNVSRSYLQTDANVKKISAHITKKVADKLAELFKEDRSGFEKKWESLGLFVKYGIIKDNNFYLKAKDFCLFENIDGKFYTFSEYKEKVAAQQTNKNNKVVYLYTTDEKEQHNAIVQAQKRGYDVLKLDSIIDMHFVQYIEHQLENTELVRVDSGPLDKLIDKGIEKAALLNEEEQKEIKAIFERFITNKMVQVECHALSEDDMPVIISRSEHLRRLEDMQRYGMFGAGEMPFGFQVVINTNHSLNKRLILNPNNTTREEIARQMYDLAMLSQNMLSGPQMTDFIHRNLNLLTRVN